MKTQEENLKESLKQLVDCAFDDATKLANQIAWLGYQLDYDSELNNTTKQWLQGYIASKECYNPVNYYIKDYLLNNLK